MTIYVDEFGPGWGRWTGGGHMLTTDIDELHALAARIGLKREWFQDKTFPHYDVTASKRRQAIAAGAIPIDNREIPDDVLMRVPARGPLEGFETRAARMGRRQPTPAQPTTAGDEADARIAERTDHLTALEQELAAGADIHALLAAQEARHNSRG